MSPIKGLSDQHRLQRLGKIRTGIKVAGRNGKEYPKAVDYFVVPDEIKPFVGDKPRELDIVIPVEDREQWATQYYRQYSRTHGLVCRGDGEYATRRIEDQGGVRMEEITCEGRECADYKAQKCKEMMNLRFILPYVPGLGIWQIDTSSINAILNINSVTDILEENLGRIVGVPLILSLEKVQVQTPNGMQSRPILHLKCKGTWQELLATVSVPQLPAGNIELDMDDSEVDEGIELVMPQNQKPKGKPEIDPPKRKSQKKKQEAPPPPPEPEPEPEPEITVEDEDPEPPAPEEADPEPPIEEDVPIQDNEPEEEQNIILSSDAAWEQLVSASEEIPMPKRKGKK